MYGQEKNNDIKIILGIACFVTNLSQLPYFVSTGITRYLNTPIWILVLLYLVIKNHGTVIIDRRLQFPIVCLALTVIGSVMWTIATENQYLSSSILSVLIISMLIFFVGTFASEGIDADGIDFLSVSYIVSALIVSASIYQQYFSSGYSLLSRQYAYASKNSISQIIFTAIILMGYQRLPKRWGINILRYGGMLLELYLLALLRSRATILGLIACIVYILFTRSQSRRLKRGVVIATALFVIVLLANASLREIIINGVIFAGRNANDMSELTSGRTDILSTFPRMMRGNWMTGIGATYFECFPLSVILNFGIIFAIPILIFAYSPLVESFKQRRNGVLREMFFMIAVGYSINSVFEGLAPFGPGVKCYYLWLLFGLLPVISNKNELEREVDMLNE